MEAVRGYELPSERRSRLEQNPDIESERGRPMRPTRRPTVATCSQRPQEPPMVLPPGRKRIRIRALTDLEARLGEAIALLGTCGTDELEPDDCDALRSLLAAARLVRLQSLALMRSLSSPG